MSHGEFSRARRRLCGVALVTALVATGCLGNDSDSGGGGGGASRAGSDEGEGEGAGTTGGGTGADPSGGTFVPDPDRIPKTRDQALRFAREAVTKPAGWGAGYVKDSPYKSGPDQVSGLGSDCVRDWRPLRPDTLVSVTRRSELPARDGTGPLRVAAVVTVHRTPAGAEWEMARTLEEALRCPEQKLNSTERITGLTSVPVPPGLRAGPHRDSLLETGAIHSDKLGGPHFYSCSQSRLGRITVAVVAKGAEGHDKREVNEAAARGHGYMREMVENKLGGPK